MLHRKGEDAGTNTGGNGEERRQGKPIARPTDG
jgi:hypothetical protein